jgi:putative DNA methylase
LPGAIPLEALRLGCEAYALDLNPVAHLIQLCTLVYPQQFGAPDPAAKGSAADGTWNGLAKEVEHWGKWVLKQVRVEIGDLYPPIPDPASPLPEEPRQLTMNLAVRETQPAYTAHLLTPVAYLWTRTVQCKNRQCGATVPLARQTWLAKKTGRYVALKPTISPRPVGEGAGGEGKKVRYVVVEATTEKGLGFDPAGGSTGGNVACPFCGTVNESGYVKAEGQAGRIGVQPLAVFGARPKETGKVYLGVDDLLPYVWPDDEKIWVRIRKLEAESLNDPAGPLTVPDEQIVVTTQTLKVFLEEFRNTFANKTFRVWPE